MKDKLILWLAEGFGAGRVGVAPGTFGSLVGMLWFAALLATGNVWVFVAANVAAVAVSVWGCGMAERILEQKDPSTVVLDEIIALPFCWLWWVLPRFLPNGSHRLPDPRELLHYPGLILMIGVFVAFRFFDILKPWPIRQSQSLPGGWGVTMDDLLAAAAVNLCGVILVPFLGR